MTVAIVPLIGIDEGKSRGGLADPGLRLPSSVTGTKRTFGVLSLTLHSPP